VGNGRPCSVGNFSGTKKGEIASSRKGEGENTALEEVLRGNRSLFVLQGGEVARMGKKNKFKRSVGSVGEVPSKIGEKNAITTNQKKKQHTNSPQGKRPEKNTGCRGRGVRDILLRGRKFY